MLYVDEACYMQEETLSGNSVKYFILEWALPETGSAFQLKMYCGQC